MSRMVARSEVVCLGCGVTMVRRNSDIARNTSGRFFCGLECRNKMGSRPRTKPLKACEQCATEFYPNYSGEQRFCSVECVAESQRTRQVAACEFCGGDYVQGKGRRERFCSRPCWIGASYKRPLDRQHNGKPAVLDNNGYVRIYEPGHPAATRSGWIFEHRHIVEQALGRALANAEHVHHLNHVRDDNRPENLQLLSHSEHSAITGKENGEALKAALEARQQLAEYVARYGPLPTIPA